DVVANALAVYDADADGPLAPSLIVGGHYSAGAGAGTLGITAWDGEIWSSIANGIDRPVRALTTFDSDGAGPPELIVGGQFTTVHGVRSPNLARWNGTTWIPVPDVNGPVFALTTFDEDGPGGLPPVLIVGGFPTQAGLVPVNRIARWNGAAWSALGDGFDGGVYALAIFDEDGDGPNPPALFAAGDIAHSGTTPVNHIARWNGQAWTALGSGLGGSINSSVYALAVHDEDGPGPLPSAFFP